MNRFASIFVAVGLTAAGPTALAAPAKSEPVLMTDAQMDDVTAGVLTIVFQDSFNNWNINLGGGGSKGGHATAKASFPGNGSAKGWEKGHGNPHRSDSASSGSSSSTQNNSMVFQLNIVSNVNAAIAGGDATAGQMVGTQTVAFTPTRR